MISKPLNWCVLPVVQEVEIRTIFSAVQLCMIRKMASPTFGEAVVNMHVCALLKHVVNSVELYINISKASNLWTRSFTSRNLFQRYNFEYVQRIGYN